MKKRLYFKASRRFFIMLAILLLASYLINATYRSFRAIDLFSNIQFILQFGLTIPLLFAYATLITNLYDNSEEHAVNGLSSKRATVLGIQIFLLISLLHVTIVQLLLVTATTKYFILQTAYFGKDFPYFGAILGVYIILCRYDPSYRMYLFRRVNSVEPHSFFGKSWEIFRNPTALLAFLRTKLPSMADFHTLDRIRYYDVFMIESMNRSVQLYLISGEKVILPYAYSRLQWEQKDLWFVKINSRAWVNMLYVDLLVSSNETLVLDKDLNVILMEKTPYEILTDMLKVRPTYRDAIRSFRKDRRALTAKGWDQPILESVSTVK